MIMNCFRLVGMAAGGYLCFKYALDAKKYSRSKYDIVRKYDDEYKPPDNFVKTFCGLSGVVVGYYFWPVTVAAVTYKYIDKN
jgi:hypothetical protein